MKVVQKKAEDGKILLDCTASTGEVSKALDTSQIQFCQQMGIRPQRDKTPAEVVSEQLGIKDFDKVIEPQAVELLVPFALDKRDISPAFIPKAQPKSPLKRGRTFQFTLEVTPKPDYELSSYDPVKITVQPMPPVEDEVNRRINDMAGQYTVFVADDPHVIGEHDDVKLAMECKKDGEPIKNLCFEGRSYTTGEGLMPEGFDKQIVGMDVGETKTFEFEAPSFGDDGKETTETYEATVTVVEAQKQVPPVINDEWVRANMPMYQSYDEMHQALVDRVTEQHQREYDDYVRGVAAGELANRFQGHIADEVYEAMVQNLVSNTRKQAQQQGKTWEQFQEENGGEQQMNMMFMLQTRQLLTQGYALDAVFRHEGLVIDDSDIDDVCRQLNPDNPKWVRSELERTGNNFSLRESAERMRANKWVVEHADITVMDNKVPAPSETKDDTAEEAKEE